ncbi:MAG: DUF5615 family PIN-like protein [Bacteroidota bacterium]|nr:DUF5615 family PIN-like protein [Bacteroidota bacterium]
MSKGHDCIHTLDLELQNNTPDRTINFISLTQQRIVITKDADFLDSFILKQEPYKLILVKLGNSSKNELLHFFANKFDEIIEKIKSEQMILLTKE